MGVDGVAVVSLTVYVDVYLIGGLVCFVVNLHNLYRGTLLFVHP